MLIEQAIEFEFPGPGPHGRTGTPKTGYFHDTKPKNIAGSNVPLLPRPGQVPSLSTTLVTRIFNFGSSFLRYLCSIKNLSFRKFLTTSLHEICGLTPPPFNQKSWLRLSISLVRTAAQVSSQMYE